MFPHITLALAASLVAVSTWAQEPATSPATTFVQNAGPHTTGVPQTGPKAEAIRKNLQRLKLPAGFRIDLYAVVPDAGRLATSPSDFGVFVGTRKNRVWVITDPEGEARPDAVKPFVPSVKFDRPEGVCMTQDGFLVVVEADRIRTFSAMELFDGQGEATRARMVEIVPQGQLLAGTRPPAKDDSRACRVGHDKQLYVALGGAGEGRIVRLDPFLGSGRTTYVSGLGAPGGIEFHPKDGALWFTDDGTGRIARAPADGQAHVQPDTQQRTASNTGNRGLAFYTTQRFPLAWRGGLFSVQGAQVMFTTLKPDGSAERSEVFAQGWPDAGKGRPWGRPVDVAQLFDGSLLISDEAAGAVYRVTYDGP